MKTALPLFLLFLLASAPSWVRSEDWNRIATETDEPGFAMRLASITPGSQAEAAGLEVGDYVYQIGARAMRAMASMDREVEEVLWYCRKNGRKGTVTVQPGQLGVHFEEILRPQIDFLRGEIGTRDPRWDDAAVAALSQLQMDPAGAETLWKQVKSLAYPDDELDAFVQAYCGWRASREIPLRATFDRIAKEYDPIPRLYATILEDMAFAAGETDLLRQLHAMDPDSSQIDASLVEKWNQFDSSPLPARSTLDEAIARRDRDLRNEILPVESESTNNMPGQIAHLQKNSRFAPGPGRFSEARFRLPDDTRDFHYSVTVECSVPEHHPVFVSEVRISAQLDSGGPAPQKLSDSLGTSLSVRAREQLPATVNISGYPGKQARRFHGPGTPMPVLGPASATTPAPEKATFRLDIIRSGREIAAYCDGFAYCRLPIDPSLSTSSLYFFVCGMEVDPVNFEIWSLSENSTNTSRSTSGPTADLLTEIRTRFDASYLVLRKPITDLDLFYAEALKRLQESESAKGNLEGVLQIKREREAFGDGSGFSHPEFNERKAGLPALEALRLKYLSERNRLWASGQKERDRLLAEYRLALGKVQQEQTKLGNVDTAVAIRAESDALSEDPRFKGAPQEDSILAKIHLVAKAEVLLWHDGEPLSYRNPAEDSNQYVDATTSDVLLAPGQVLYLRMRSNVVYRSFILTMESKGGTVAIPVTVDNIRYLGPVPEGSAPETDADAVLRQDQRPDKGRPDDEMLAMWNAKPISALSRQTSEWAKSGPGSEWHAYGVVITKDMLQKIAAQ